MAEATLTAPEETQVPQPEEQAPSPPAPETQEPPAEQASAEPPSLESALEEFLRPKEDADEAAPEGSESEKPLSPEAQAEVNRVLAERETAAQKASRELGVLNSFRDNATTLRTWAAQVSLPQQETEKLVAFFRDYHGVSGQIHRAEASEAAATETVNAFYDAMSKELPASKRQGFLNARGTEHKSYADTTKAFLAMAREGYVPVREVAKAKEDAKAELRAFLIEKKLLKGADAPPAENSGGVGGSNKPYTQMSPEERARLTPEQRDQAVQRELSVRSI